MNELQQAGVDELAEGELTLKIFPANWRTTVTRDALVKETTLSQALPKCAGR